jgi:hypothetical protein
MSADESLWSTEWARARDVIEKCDERVQDIRKVGFAFLSTLMTAETLVWHKASEPLGGAAGFALLLIALATLFAVRIFEKHTQLLQSAASSRARALELFVPVELTEIISDRHAKDGWPLYTTLLYLLFGAVAVVTSLVIAQPTAWLWRSILAGLFYGACLVRLALLEIKLPHKIDVSLDRVTCRTGETVAIAAVNLHDAAQPTPAITIRSVQPLRVAAATSLTVPKIDGFEEGRLRPRQSIVWQWVAGEPGVYAIELETDGEVRTLRRMIRVAAPDTSAADDAPTSGG